MLLQFRHQGGWQKYDQSLDEFNGSNWQKYCQSTKSKLGDKRKSGQPIDFESGDWQNIVNR